MSFVSIIIPTRHRNHALRACLGRLGSGGRSHGPGQFEVIVTDDGSDTTAELMVRQAFPWVHWTAGPRRGPAANRNHGARKAKGEWIAFVDDDCLPSTGWLAAFAKAAAAGGEVFEGRTTCDAGLASIMEEAPINLTGGNLWSCNMMLSRRVWQGLGGFDERFPHAAYEDIEFNARLQHARLPVTFVPNAVVDHPPRLKPLGQAAGKLWEGRMLLKQLDPNHRTEWLPLHVAKIRAAQWLRARTLPDRIRFAWSSAIEVAVVAARHGRWKSKYIGAEPKTTSLSS